MPGMQLVIELDERGSIKKVTTLDKSFNKLKKRVTGASATMAKGMSKIRAGTQGLSRAFGRLAMMGKLAFAAMAVAAVVVGAKFEQSMANVASVAGASAEELKRLSGVARAWGKQTVFSASEAAEAMYSLASAGQSVVEIEKSIGGVLLFAGAAATSLAQAAETVVQALKMFNLEAAQSDRVVNVFAAGIAASMLTAERLKEALSQVGSTAHAMGLDIEETVGTLGMLHNAGMLGGIAGTRLKGVLSRLASPNAVLRDLLGGVAFNGKNLAEIMQKLSDEGATAGEVFKSFGRIAAPAVLAMMSAGQKEMEKMTEKVTGTRKAFEMYQKQMDTVSSDFKILKSAIQENMIAAFMSARVAIRGTLQTLIRLTNEAKPYIIGMIKTTASWMKENKGLVKTIAKVAGTLMLVAIPIAILVKTGMALYKVYQVVSGSLMLVVGAFQKVKAWGIATHAKLAADWISYHVQLVALTIASKVKMAAAWVSYHAQLIALTVASKVKMAATWVSYHAQLIALSAAAKVTMIANWVAIHIAALGPWGILIGVAVAAVGVLIYYMVKYRDKVKEVMKKVGEGFKTVFSWIADKATWLSDKIRAAFAVPFNWIMGKLKWLAEKAGWLMEKIIPGWKEKWATMADVVKEKTKAAGGAIAYGIGAGLDWVEDKSERVISAVGGALPGLVDKIKGAVESMKTLGQGSAEIAIKVEGGDVTGETDEEKKRRARLAQETADNIAAAERMADERNAALHRTIAYEQEHTAAWLAAKEEMINNSHLDYIESAARTAEEVARSEIERDAQVMEARMQHEDAVMEHYLYNNELRMAAITGLSTAYDTALDMMIEGESNFHDIREAMWEDSKRGFLRSLAGSLKKELAMRMKNILLASIVEKKANASSKLAEAKLGAVKAYQAFAAIPIIGPILGAAAAAAAFAFLMAFHSGGLIGGQTGEVLVRAETGEYVMRRSAVRNIGADTLGEINRTGQLPQTLTSSSTFQFNIQAGSQDDADELAERIEDEVIPIIEELASRGRTSILLRTG